MRGIAVAFTMIAARWNVLALAAGNMSQRTQWSTPLTIKN